jgi:hypothetical protein
MGSDVIELLRSEDEQFNSLFYADRQPGAYLLDLQREKVLITSLSSATYTPSVDAAGTAVPCNDKCIQVLSTSTFLTQQVIRSRLTQDMVGKTL